MYVFRDLPQSFRVNTKIIASHKLKLNLPHLHLFTIHNFFHPIRHYVRYAVRAGHASQITLRINQRFGPSICTRMALTRIFYKPSSTATSRWQKLQRKWLFKIIHFHYSRYIRIFIVAFPSHSNVEKSKYQLNRVSVSIRFL